MPFCCFTTGIFLNRNVFTPLCLIVDSVFFTIQKATSWAKISIVKVGRGRRSRSQSSVALETGHFCSKQWKTIFLRARCSFYSVRLLLGEYRGYMTCHILLISRVENTSPRNSQVINPRISYSCSLKLSWLLVISDAIYIKASYF